MSIKHIFYYSFTSIWIALSLVACNDQDVASPTMAPSPDGSPSTGTQMIPTVELTPVVVEPTPTATPDPLYSGTGDMPWWNDTVFYELFVRSFYDSDGDGVGDIQGVIQQLDYLNDGDPDTTGDLGITGLWLMPIMESPSYHGYDVVDYYQVDQEYGTEEDFRQLIEEANARGIRVVVDLILNHTSSQHPWFVEAKDPESEFRDYYVWSEENPGYRGPSAQKVWHESDSGYYYAVFWDQMPDLNLENPAVTESIHEVARFWLEDMGVDGFRLDAIKHLVEDGRLQENTPATHQWLGDFYTFYKGINPNAFTVGEAWTGTQQVVDYTGDEVDIAFQFDLAEDIISSSREGIGSLLTKSQSEIVEAFPASQYATFLANHDQNRVMSQFKGDEEAAKIAASILLTSPGVPFIYYGEEIGMMGVKPDEDIRLPMQWTGSGPAAGFTEGIPWRAPNANFNERNVAHQDTDPGSLLNHYRTLIQLRNQSDALRVGDWLLVESEPGRLYAFLRYVDDEVLLVLVNPSKRAVDDYTLSLSESPLRDQIEALLLFGEGSVVAPIINEKGGFINYTPLETLPPQSTYILRLSS